MSTSGPSDKAVQWYDLLEFRVGFSEPHQHQMKRWIESLQQFCGWCGKTENGYRPRPIVEQSDEERQRATNLRRAIRLQLHGSFRPERQARQDVADFINDTGEYPYVEFGETYLVWFSKVLANWKGLVIIRSKRGSGTVFDDLYFEVSHDGTKGSTYIDAYRKITNVEITDNRKE